MLPKDRQIFSFDSYEINLANGEAAFRYSIGPDLHFTEIVAFHGAREHLSSEESHALDNALHHLHLALGVSYFKAFIPPQIEVRTRPLPGVTAEFFSKLYERGLGEFAYINDLDLRGKITFPSTAVGCSASSLPLRKRTVVPIGGGKDSLVTVELLKQTENELCTLTVGDFPLLEPLLEEIGLEHLRISRRIDPLLFELNSQGAYNGHVPFSSMLAFMMPVAAVLQGFDTIAMSQERSADSGNVVHHGQVVNHQYSKSFEFEQDFSQFVRTAVLTNLKYFSLLRPFSELSIAERFSKLTQYHSKFTSCNRAFRILGSQTPQRWCCDCPKCRFVFLALAPYMSRESLLGVFSKDLLSDPAQVGGYRELLGIEGHKPFECVGEVEESRAALLLVASKPEWKSHLPLQSLVKELHGLVQPRLESITALSPQHQIPAEFLDTLYATR